ncbi:hypothetical protein [Pseudomonas sp. TWI929]|uniref:hypothetical protein n=1 Tax=Pseudomonas sp. TWI929 TaxID=3136795 RepID=UPI003208CFCD
MKAVIAGVLAVLIAGGGWFGWNKYQSGLETTAAVQSIQQSSTQTERQLNARKEDGITFAEYFKRSISVMESLDHSISSLEARQWNYVPSDRDLAIAFIEQCKSIVRAAEADTRLMMDESNARESTDAAKKELDEADSSVALEWALKRYKRASNELLEVLHKQLEAIEGSTDKVKKMVAADDAVKAAFGPDKGLTQTTVSAMKKSLEPEPKEKPSEG